MTRQMSHLRNRIHKLWPTAESYRVPEDCFRDSISS